MDLMEDIVRTRYFSSFIDNEPYILFSADSLSVRRLENVFRELADGKLDRVELTSLDFVWSYFNIILFASVSEKDIGVEQGGKKFEWTLSADRWDDYAERLTPFHDGQNGHQYLDFPYSHQSITVMVSIDEYSADWIGWKREEIKLEGR